MEGSTRLVKQLRDRYGEILAEHQRLLRAAFADHGGHEIDTQGDSFFVAFASARDAVLAAVEGQRALLSHQWPDAASVRVRIGIHTGQAGVTDGQYTGLAVHRAARIAAAAHGGQILVSQATQTLLEDEEEDLRIALRDLGEHPLKDLDRPVRLYQADADGLPPSFPPLRLSGGLGHAGEAAVEAPRWRRPVAIVAALLMAAVLVVAGVLVSTRGGDHAAAVQPNHVGIIDPETNAVVGNVAVGSNPGPMAKGNGSIWVGNLDDRTVTRISVQRHARTRSIPLNGRTPTGLGFGGGGLWIAHGLRGQVSRVDPRANRVLDTIDVADPGSRRGSVAVGAGSVWAAFGDSTLARIDPKRADLDGATFAGAGPAGVAVTAGSVWVVNSGDATVSRFRPRTYESGATGRPIRVGRKPVAIAAGEGALWVADAGADAVTRIDPGTHATSTIPVGAGPTAVTVGGGLVWVANTAAGTVSRIDPLLEKVVATIDVGNGPSGIVFDGDFLWVAVQAR